MWIQAPCLDASTGDDGETSIMSRASFFQLHWNKSVCIVRQVTWTLAIKRSLAAKWVQKSIKTAKIRVFLLVPAGCWNNTSHSQLKCKLKPIFFFFFKKNEIYFYKSFIQSVGGKLKPTFIFLLTFQPVRLDSSRLMNTINDLYGGA